MPTHLTSAIWTNANLSDAALSRLRSGAAGHAVLKSNVATSNLHPGTADAQLSTAGIAFGQPDPQQVIELPNLHWVHLTSAGYTRYDNDAVREALQRRGGMLTSSSSVYNEPCAEHVLAMMLAGARQLPQAYGEHLGTRGWRSSEVRAGCTLLKGQTALIFGYGAIARRLVELLEPFHLKLTAVRRSIRGDENCRTVTTESADSLLATADHVIDILPASSSTDGFFSAERLARLPPTATFYNIGRGTTVDQPALAQALQSNSIRAAFLDVTDPEPLPPNHALWQLDNCHITPHSAGGHATEFLRLVDHFLANLNLYNRHQPLLDRVF